MAENYNNPPTKQKGASKKTGPSTMAAVNGPELPPSVQASAFTLQSEKPLDERALQALREYQQISRELRVVNENLTFIALDQGCPESPQWCLPDLNCSARSTLDQKAKAVFNENKERCKEGNVID